MKGLVVLLCAFVAVQARSGALVQRSGVEAAKGEQPWLVHLRTAIATSGLLQTYAGSLIHESWILTSASSLTDARFIWVRYGTVNVVNPELVTENSAVRLHPGYAPEVSPLANNIGLISINRVIHTTANIAPVALPVTDEARATPSSATFCSYNDPEVDVPGVVLKCFEEELSEVEVEEATYIAVDLPVSRFDVGAALVSDGVQVGVLADASGNFVRTSDYLEWIQEQSGVDFSSKVPAVNGNDYDPTKVIFVN